MRVSVQRWGNSLALRIPKSFATESRITNGSSVDLSLSNGKIIIAPVPERNYRLHDLLAKITRKNIHCEMETGKPVGKEVW